ncbi:MAG: acetyl-CoA carboxylase carboxyltransferase subunit alpha [Elusimicrobia bacterium RIFCSPLOWO2_01_FULL_60_11]|nr:MAG: acetyl-CoA carboxylase carboxyltransferase subunit alpha [Elusimicrobia bacterium RIFCSPLOWO2_01_FULL_60_11]
MADETSALDFEIPIVELENKIAEIRTLNQSETVNLDQEIKSLEEKRDRMIREIFSGLTPWQRVQLARHPKRPHTRDYVQALFTDFTELHGDRLFGDDAALLAGTAFLAGNPVVVMGHQKGRSIEDSMMRNFGMMHPEGYRRAIRLMKLAEKFRVPVITFIDTAGAYPGIGAEERGQAQAIALNLMEMSALKVPIVSVVIGEGGSGGALGIGVTDRILMLENSWYSVISPEGCAAILFHDAARAQDSSRLLKLTARDLLEFGVVDEIVAEPAGGAHRNAASIFESVSDALQKHLKELKAIPAEKLLDLRYEKYRKQGQWSESKESAPKRAKKNKDLEK